MPTLGEFIGHGIIPNRRGRFRIFTDLDRTDYLYLLRGDDRLYVPRSRVLFVKEKRRSRT